MKDFHGERDNDIEEEQQDEAWKTAAVAMLNAEEDGSEVEKAHL